MLTLKLIFTREMKQPMSLDPMAAQYKAASTLQTGVVTGVSGTEEGVQDQVHATRVRYVQTGCLFSIFGKICKTV